ncbi:MAG: STAS domain-containing protein [Actinobacteria bacterium]|nr:MAG: STAS domain-containing protein [Actinomycetota bacterium]
MGFSATLSRNGRIALITLEGELDALHADDFRNRVEQAANGGQIDQLVLDMTDLTYMSSAGMRGLVFARQKMGEDIRIVLVRASDSVEQTIRLVGFHQSVVFSDEVPG